MRAAAGKPRLFAGIDRSAMLQQGLCVDREIVLPCGADDIGWHLLSQRPNTGRRQ
jgi:hypothetical protein